jgi:glycosyltransferase involved in cell wall biosynthesis/predicted O-methyltransferase YrrM
MSTIGLCMIVKNESKVILRCLESARAIVDYVLIEDTGSTDGTQTIIREWLDRTGIPGEVYDEPWRDFAYNRSHVLARLREKESIDYALILDADDHIVYGPGFDAAAFKREMSADVYDVELRNEVTFRRCLICSNRRAFRYRGVLHEFLERPADAATSGVVKEFYVASTREGSRGQDPEKYRKDAEILKKALETEEDPLLRSRYAFYLAQSYQNAGEKEQALEAYLKRAELGHWSEEVFLSLYCAGHLQQALDRPIEESIASYLRAADAAPSRAESYHAASRLCRENKRFTDAYEYARRGVAIPLPADGLFVEPWIYEFGLLDELSIGAYWVGHYRESLEACERLLKDGKLSDDHRERIEDNARIAHEKLSTGPKDSAPEVLAKVTTHNAPPKISLIICSRNRASQLAATLGKLDLGDLTRNGVELTLINSASNDSTREVMRHFKEKNSLAVNIGEADRPGLGLARNIGIEISSGDVIVFTDDDCYLDANYFDILATLWDKQSFQYGGGQILLYRASFDLRVASLSIGYREDILPYSILGTGSIQGANMFFGREVFERVGLFNEDMGAGTPFACEDIEMATRASMHGFRGIWLPELKVQHDHGRKRGTPEANQTVEGYDFGRGAYYAALTVAGYQQTSQLPTLLKLPQEIAGAQQYLEFASRKQDSKQFEAERLKDPSHRALNGKTATLKENFPSYAVRRVQKAYPELTPQYIQNCLAYSTYVNLDRKYLYYEVPKAACTSMKLLIHSLEKLPPFAAFAGDQPEVRREMFVHERSEFKLPSLLDFDNETQKNIINSPDFFRFTIVRNPYTRLQSAWKDKILTCAPGFEHFYYQIKGGLPQGSDSASRIMFQEFVAAISRDDLTTCNPHWRSQVAHLFLRTLDFSFVGRLESLAEAVSTFLKHAEFAPTQIPGAANQSQATGEYDQELADKVFALYERDFVDLGYEKDSWKSNASRSRVRTVSEERFVDEITERNIIIGHLYSERTNLRERLQQIDAPKSDSESETLHTSDFDELFQRHISGIDGWLSKQEAAYLYGLAKGATEGCIVEVGSYRGRSTASLAFGVDAGARLPVYAVEPHEQFSGLFGGEFGPADRGSFMKTMIETGLYRHVRLVNVSSEFLSEKWPMPVSVLFIDGDHRYEAVKRDFDRWRGKLAPGAVVVLDDALDPSSGPGQLAEELVATGKFVRAPAIGKMGCLLSFGAASGAKARSIEDGQNDVSHQPVGPKPESKVELICAGPLSNASARAETGQATSLSLPKKLGIIIPYRNREEHLHKFLPHVISYFQREGAQKIGDLKIIIAEQADELPFNRGGLLNAGFLAIEDMVDYVCFHDVDYLPMWADYSYAETPTRIIWWGMHTRPIRVSDRSLWTSAPKIGLGAVSLLTNQHFRTVNGYSNRFFGWGFEDKDLAARCSLHSLTIAQRDGTFIPLDHDNAGFLADGSQSPSWRKNEQQYTENQREYQHHGTAKDGLSSLTVHRNSIEHTTVPGLDPGERADVMRLSVNLNEIREDRDDDNTHDRVQKVLAS